MCVSQGRIKERGKPKANIEDGQSLCQAKETEGKRPFLVERFIGSREQSFDRI